MIHLLKKMLMLKRESKMPKIDQKHLYLTDFLNFLKYSHLYSLYKISRLN